MESSNRITKIAIVGAGGNSGRFMTEALLKTGTHTVTAISRVGSQAKLPEGVIIKYVNYDEPESLVEALQGQEALVITLGGSAPQETQPKLIEAAAKAGVPWILPNEWSPDSTNEALVKDVFPFQSKVTIRKMIEGLGKSSYISVITGFWYEWSLAIVPAFGFDFANRKVTFFDEGETNVSLSTWPQIGRAVAALLSLPIKSEAGNLGGVCLENFRNEPLFINAFTVSQKDMLASVLRVTGSQESDWMIEKEVSHQRYADGLKGIQEGQRVGFAKMMYTRVFFSDGCGDFEAGKGTMNKLLGLPEVDIDEATRVAIERSKKPLW